ncbi:MAG: transglutaminase-like domain-containing protein [bacterium]
MRELLPLAVAVMIVVGCPGRPGTSADGIGSAQENWLVTELMGYRVGYSVTRAERFAQGWRFESSMRIDVAMLGVDQEVSAQSVTTAGTDLTLQSVSFRYQGQDRLLEATAVVQENNLIVKLLGEPARAQNLTEPLYPVEALGRLVFKRRAVPGSSFEVSVFDVGTMTTDRVKLEVMDWETVQAGDSSYHALRVRTTSSVLSTTTWLDSLGMPVVEEAPPGLRSVRSTPAEAVASAGREAGVDLLRMFRVPVDTTIEAPEAVRRFRFELAGVSADELSPEIGTVTVLDEKLLLVEVVAAEPPASLAGLPVAGQDSFLSPTMVIQCDAPELRERAEMLTAGETDAVAVARALAGWVYDYVEKVPTASFPTALDVLRNPQGDCNEHAVLYAGLARAAGIPCRVVVGLVYMERAFYYHAWNEAWLGRWVGVDPTFNEFPASALHLKLSEGDLREQARVLPLVGRIAIRALEFE